MEPETAKANTKAANKRRFHQNLGAGSLDNRMSIEEGAIMRKVKPAFKEVSKFKSILSLDD